MIKIHEIEGYSWEKFFKHDYFENIKEKVHIIDR